MAINKFISVLDYQNDKTKIICVDTKEVYPTSEKDEVDLFGEIFHKNDCDISNLTKGGLLEDYFKGRVITEHDSYVTGRHNKTSYKLTNVKCEIIPNNESNFTSGNINIRYFINDVEYIGNCKYNSRVNNDTYFYFALSNINIKCGDIGISKTGKRLLRYICAMEYRKKYKNDDCNINLVEW